MSKRKFWVIPRHGSRFQVELVGFGGYWKHGRSGLTFTLNWRGEWDVRIPRGYIGAHPTLTKALAHHAESLRERPQAPEKPAQQFLPPSVRDWTRRPVEGEWWASAIGA